jgi:hypothetical protein
MTSFYDLLQAPSHSHTHTLFLLHTLSHTTKKHPAAYVCAKMREPIPCYAKYVSLTQKYYDVSTTTTITPFVIFIQTL